MQEDGLAELAALAQGSGWAFPLRGNEDTPLLGVREGRVVTETVCIRSEKEVTVARLLTEDWLNAHRGGLHWVLWHFTGSLADAIGGIAPVEREAGHDRLIEESSTYYRAAHAASRAAGLLWFVVGFGISEFLALTVDWPGVAVGLSLIGYLVSVLAVVVQRRPLHRLPDSLTGADLAGSSGMHRFL